MRIGRFSGALPLVLMTILIVAVGAFATVRQDAFLTSFNLHNLLLLTLPLAFVSLGQTFALLVGGFDVSVAALMTFCVVVASYTLSYDTSGWKLLPGALAIVAMGLATGIFNAVLVCVLKLPSIIATLGTFSILEGASLLLRDFPEGPINDGRHRPTHEERQLRSDRLHRRRGARRPRRCVAVSDAHRASLSRAVGLDETSSRRLGMATGRIGVPRVRRLLGDGVARGLLPRGPGSDRLADSSATSGSRASPAPSSAERASPEAEDRSWARCWRRSSSR